MVKCFKKLFTNFQQHAKSTAFTLAEILIVISIIGLVAEITIPSVVQKFNEEHTVVALKKFYSTFSQAYISILNEQGDPSTWGLIETNPEERVEANKKLMGYFEPYLRIDKNCGVVANTGCLPSAYRSIYSNTNQSQLSDTNTYSAKAHLADGMLLSLWLLSTDCAGKRGDSLQLQNICGVATIDINGFNKPNVEGKDAFRFLITKYGILPFASPDETTYTFSNNCINNAKTTSWGCTGWVLVNNNMDYLHCSDLSWNGKQKCN